MENILDRVEAQIRRYCILPTEDHYVAATLWVAATHVAEIAHTATRLCIGAPEKRCGKTRTMEVLMSLSWRAESLVDTSKAALVALIDQGGGVTIFADEADQWLPKGGPLVGIINAGHQKGKFRTVMENGQPIKQSTFAFVCVAGIGRFPDTIADRAISFNMKRRGPGEKVEPFRLLRDQRPLVELGTELHEELHERMDDLRVIEPRTPVEDRAADNWELLLMIAELYTEPNQTHNPKSWAYRAYQAAIALTEEAEEMREETRSQKLLVALRSMFKRAERMRSDEICTRLAKSDPEYWADFTQRQLYDALGPYGVKSKAIKFPGKGDDPGGTFRGYTRDMFTDVFARYLPKEGEDPGLKAV